MTTTYHRGDKVVFANPTPDESGLVMTVAEDRDDRVLVTDDDMTPSEWPIMPTFQYLKTDLHNRSIRT